MHSYCRLWSRRSSMFFSQERIILCVGESASSEGICSCRSVSLCACLYSQDQLGRARPLWSSSSSWRVSTESFCLRAWPNKHMELGLLQMLALLQSTQLTNLHHTWLLTVFPRKFSTFAFAFSAQSSANQTQELTFYSKSQLTTPAVWPNWLAHARMWLTGSLTNGPCPSQWWVASS